MAAGVKTVRRGCAELRALRRKIRSRHRQWRAGNLGAGEGIVFSSQGCSAWQGGPRLLGKPELLCHNTSNKIVARGGAKNPPAAKKPGGFSWPISAFSPLIW